ncbi:MAG TPA: hypothetical protein VEB21_16570, partial [Terriglobales bacterium]|nr:hypothetical protein [Terriglobales bacterium]
DIAKLSCWLRMRPSALFKPVAPSQRKSTGQEDRRTRRQEDKKTGGQEDRRTGGQEDRKRGERRGEEEKNREERLDFLSLLFSCRWLSWRRRGVPDGI